MKGAVEPGLVARGAPAKLNLYLHLLSRRDDGYHELDSLVAFAEHGDRLAFAQADLLSLDVVGPFAEEAPGGEDNLVLRAARRLAEASGVAAGARIYLDKRLPVAAGLGGGSADAAAALSGLIQLWRLTPRPGLIEEVARGLGADVPVCLFGRPAFVGGVGERIEPAPPLPAADLVLVNPRVSLPTASVYGARRGAFSPPARWRDPVADAPALARLLESRRNDLFPAALALAPSVAEAIAAISECEGVLIARMSGSGATCFGLFASEGEAAAAEARIRALRPGWWVIRTRLAGGGNAGNPRLSPERELD